MNILKFSIQHSRRKHAAFTSAELLVVLGLVIFCTVLILPALGRPKTNSSTAQCLNNLRQFSSAISMYAVENQNSLPGSCWSAVYGNYDATSSLRFGLLKYLAPFLGAEPASTNMQRSDIADCPGSLRFRKTSPTFAHILATNVSYHLPQFITNNVLNPPSSICDAPVQDRLPFGYPSKSIGASVCGSSSFDYPGMKISNIKLPGRTWAMQDVDAKNTLSSTAPGTANYGQFLPLNRVHQGARNYLFFDGRAATIKD